jgi:4-amino-4-deoxy-L-arabinose transferase-like glycosyltransferase
VEGRNKKSRIAVREGSLFGLYVAGLLVVGVLTIGQIGITWDEPNYFGSSYSYLMWFAHVVQEPGDWWTSIDRYWSPSHEAPPFFKLWAGLFAGAGALLFGTEDLARIGDAYRMGSYAFFLLSMVSAYRFMREEFGVAAGWGAAVSMPLIPALFGFARLGQLDGAAASMYLISALALYQMLTHGGQRRVVWAGVLLGLAFATKLSVFTLVPAALFWTVVYRRERAAFGRLFASFGVGAATFFAVWPWLWRDPVRRTWEFLTWAGGLQDERLQYYLGEWWAGAPWHYPLVLLIALAPLPVAAAGVLGAARLFREARRGAAGWVLLHLSLILAVAGSGLVPIYGGPRQFLAAFPLWALCAGAGIGWLAGKLPIPRVVTLAACAALSLPGILWTGTDNSLEYYGEAVGLIPGAHALGFETTYLADTYEPAVEWISSTAPEGATVYTQAGTYAVLESYRRVGTLREDLRPAYLSPIAPEKYVRDEEPREGSYFLFLPRQSIYTDQMISLNEKEPLFSYEKGGVPLVKVYSGDAVSGTLDIQGRPAVRDVGLLNAVVAAGLVCATLLALARARRRAGKDTA